MNQVMPREGTSIKFRVFRLFLAVVGLINSCMGLVCIRVVNLEWSAIEKNYKYKRIINGKQSWGTPCRQWVTVERKNLIAPGYLNITHHTCHVMQSCEPDTSALSMAHYTLMKQGHSPKATCHTGDAKLRDCHQCFSHEKLYLIALLTLYQDSESDSPSIRYMEGLITVSV